MHLQRSAGETKARGDTPPRARPLSPHRGGCLLAFYKVFFMMIFIDFSTSISTAAAVSAAEAEAAAGGQSCDKSRAVRQSERSRGHRRRDFTPAARDIRSHRGSNHFHGASTRQHYFQASQPPMFDCINL